MWSMETLNCSVMSRCLANELWREDMKFITKELINKGWSSDKKYCVTDENGTHYLYRVSDIAEHDTKQSEFN